MPRRLLTPILALGAALPGLACDAYDEPLPPPPGLVTQEVPPPAISGGSLLVTDGGLAVAADTDRDRIWVVDTASGELVADVSLDAGERPGRLVEDADGHVHVALRGSGVLLTLDPAAGEVLSRRDVCPAPRGLAYDDVLDTVHVACAGGELVSMPAAGGEATRTLRLEPDLRDVVVQGDKLVVTRFRSAEVLVLGSDGALLGRTKPAKYIPVNSFGSQEFQASVAWRMVGMPTGGVIISHQRSMTSPIVLASPAYYSAAGCDSSIVHAAVTIVDSTLVPSTTPAPTVPLAPLPVDVAVSADGARFAMVAAGSDEVFETKTADAKIEIESFNGECSVASTPRRVGGQPVAVAYDGRGRLIVQTREPAGIVMIEGTEAKTVQLPADSVWDTGHDMFHRSPNQFARTSVACASCHPEGGDDAHTWQFDIGLRRTQNIAGGVLATAPLHWDGDLGDMDAFMGEVFIRRMAGVQPGPRKTSAFARWVDAIPQLPVSEPDDIDAVARGRVVFEDATVGCATCHNGDRFTNDENKDVGTGKAFQVPSLISVGMRGPYMHDGCAATLRERFTNESCGGGDKHGVTSHLTDAQIDDLVVYLQSL